MRFLVAAHTDAGIIKKVNEDSFCIKVARTHETHIAFALVCDGMGGLKHGELASSWVVNSLSAWFEEELPKTMQKDYELNQIQERWNDIILNQNVKIANYSKINGYSKGMGTTLSGILIIGNRFLTAQVGDSRIYRINSDIEQLTRDQTVIASELEKHFITEEEAKNDPRRSTLLQCIGASKILIPEYAIGMVQEDDVFMLCSDGFRHEVSDSEFKDAIRPNLLNSEKAMKKILIDLIERNKCRKEKDNITALLVRAIDE